LAPNIYYIPDEFITDAFVSILLDNIEDISANFDNEKDVRCFIAKFPLQFREKVVKRIIDSYGIVDLCKCKQRKTKNICVVGMGNDDDDIYATMERVKRRGEPYWWLYLSKCKICNEYWLTGQDHSINDRTSDAS